MLYELEYECGYKFMHPVYEDGCVTHFPLDFKYLVALLKYSETDLDGMIMGIHYLHALDKESYSPLKTSMKSSEECNVAFEKHNESL